MPLATADDFMQELEGSAAVQPRSSLVVLFSSEAQENGEKSRKAGRKVFDDVEVIEIRNPGELDVIRRAATDRDRQSFPRQYLAFKRSQTQETVSGFPLAQWAQIKKSQVEEARFFGIHTIEQLAAVADSSLQRLGPGWTPLRQLARDWEKAAAGGAVTSQLRAELDAAKAQIATMQDMLTKQAAALRQDPATSTGAAVQYVPAQDEKIAKLESIVGRLMNQMTSAPPRTLEESDGRTGALMDVAAIQREPPKKVDGRSKAARAAKAARDQVT
jgi:hypothetical protein